jgi:hypothetical protein
MAKSTKSGPKTALLYGLIFSNLDWLRGLEATYTEHDSTMDENPKNRSKSRACNTENTLCSPCRSEFWIPVSKTVVRVTVPWVRIHPLRQKAK